MKTIAGKVQLLDAGRFPKAVLNVPYVPCHLLGPADNRLKIAVEWWQFADWDGVYSSPISSRRYQKSLLFW